ncbi:hypothetical protein DFP93_102162 [Aneurinibacillus soli]|uniref:Uncharacterized protein n=1 Tax=Aneurinibacillus soli TaxID=1500254 RepID=A0A0U5AV06_9BACL|nr:hypothetical protein [Aneurinibacillus soli]PYE63478.1 hypothetical protein DFP93_102162 [Aneurinibacillus soli]BAU27589.1 hypothetical protein CB4_01763 [Aneurinibacillus soli]
MFNATAREKLADKVGYERFVLKECVLAVGEYLGNVSDRIDFEFDDSPITTVCMYVESSLCSDAVSKAIEKLSPLMFTTSYKVLDMIFEWLLAQNQISRDGGFTGKIQKLRTDLFTPPPSLENEEHLIQTLVALYDTLRPYRNALVHHGWGNIEKGNLHFTVEKPKITNKEITLKQVISFSNAMSLLSSELISPNGHPYIINTIKWLLDHLQTFHGVEPFNIGKPAHYNVIHRTNIKTEDIPEIDLKFIRKRLDRNDPGHPFSFTIFIHVQEGDVVRKWQFESSQLEEIDTLILDDKWNDYLA